MQCLSEVLIEIHTENIYLDNEYCKNTVFDISEGNYICIKIKDSGSGIKKEYLKKIFDPYFTADKGENFSGIGLSVVYGAVIEHKGAVYVESSEGKGTTLIMYFPVSASIK